ncbi:trypsin-like peptidase domain-containing protein [Dactylosporangium sp. NPDC051541]|uniref:trypsin-like peptidase domain-containing protein n=1 Tax=Dactylosporangium sp. NPDC051541 TaxID=3363977 RepID=UPI00379ED87E
MPAGTRPAVADPGRVVAISPDRPAADGSWSFGTGYLIAPRLVLTAAHVLPDLTAPVNVRRRAERSTARVVWSGLDVALLHIDDPGWAPPVAGPCRWGRFTTAQPGLPCAAIGYPLSQVPTGARSGEERTAEHVAGHINPITGEPIGRQVAGRYAISVDDATPLTTAPGQTPWAGASGSAVVCGAGLVVGVIVTDELAYQHGRLTAVRAERLFARPGFRAAVAAGGGGTPWLESVELAPLLVEPTPARTGAPPAYLLLAENEVVRFRGRRAELDRLLAWCDERPGLQARLLHGGGGQGKTRLARELVARLRGAGWLAGELRRRVDPDRLWLLGSIAGPTLYVLDYAETATPDSVDAVIRELAAYAGEHPVRLLLLARTAGEWWDELRARLLVDAEAVGLAALEDSVPGREAAYRTALADFATARGTSGPDHPDPPDLTAGHFGSVLAIHMRALADLLQAGPDPVGGAGPAPEDILLAHEERYWSAYWSERIGFPEPRHRSLLRRAVAAATMYGAATRAETIGLLRSLPGWTEERPNVWEFAADWLHELYPPPADGYLGGLQPDPLGEHLVAGAVRDTPGLVTDLLPAGAGDQIERGLTVLSRVAARHDGIAALTTATFAAAPRRLAAHAVAVAVRAEQPEMLVAGLRAALAALRSGPAAPDMDTDTALAELADALPPSTIVLAEYAVEVMAAFAEAVEPGPGEPPDLLHCDLLAALALRLSMVGRYADALATGERARDALDTIDADPDGPDAEARRATRLSVLTSVGLALQGQLRYDEAARVQREVIDLVQRAADADGAGRAILLSNLAAILALAGRDGEATTSATQVGALLAERGAVEPLLLGPALAGLSMAEPRGERRIELLTEAVASAREGVRTDPDVHAMNLALCLSLLGGALYEEDQSQLARAGLEEAVAILRAMRRSNPGLADKLLVGALTTLARVLHDLGLDAEALGPAEAAVAHMRAAFGREFDDDLASILTLLVGVRERLERFADMEIAAEEALEVYRRLAYLAPEPYLPMVSRLLRDRSRAIQEQRGAAAAIASEDEALRIDRALFADAPETFRSRFARALGSAAGTYGLAGRHDTTEALLAEAELVLRGGPGDTPAERRLLADVFLMRARMYQLQRRFDRAQEPARAADALYRGLAEADPAAAPGLEVDRCDTAEVLAIAASARGDHDEAVAAAEVVVGLRRRHAVADLNAVWPLIGSLTALAGMLVDAGRPVAALGFADEAIRLSGPVDSAPPQPFERRFGLAEALIVRGLALAATGEPEPAAASVAAAVERLDRLDPELGGLSHLSDALLDGAAAVYGRLLPVLGDRIATGAVALLVKLCLAHERYGALRLFAEPAVLAGHRPAPLLLLAALDRLERDALDGVAELLAEAHDRGATGAMLELMGELNAEWCARTGQPRPPWTVAG